MNKLHLLDDILYNGLQPWLPENNPDDKFASMLSEIKAVEPDFPVKYELDFIRPFNYKTKYYQKLILREMNQYCNRVISLIADDDNHQVKKYWLNITLDKKIKTRLKEIGKLIKEKHLDLAYIDPNKNTFDLDINHKTDTYIFQLLKCCFIKIYLEIEHVFLSFRTDVMEIEDFYTQLLLEPIPINTFIKETPLVFVIETLQSKVEQPVIPVITEQKEEFIPRHSDFRGSGKSPVRYADIRNVEVFSKFEKNLFDSRMINGEYEFQDIHGNKNTLAALYKILIQKNYFREKNIKNGHSFEDYHFRQYLDFRYKVNTDQQFRKCDSDAIQKIKHKYFWIDNIEYCR